MMKMSKNKTKLVNLILPNKRINFFIITILILGVISGSIFLMTLVDLDKSSVITHIQNFFENISNDAINDGLALKNSLIINYLFVGLIWGFGLSMIGIVVNIFLTYIKGFLIGFSVGAIFLTYSYKGIVASLLYILIGQLLNIIVIMVLSIYSIMFAKNLFKIVINKNGGTNRLMLKKYLVIFIFSIFITFISSMLEVYIFPKVLKLIIQYYL